eukprot:scaffold62806_cov74-Cyclotella_meneghiniana.AAC.5
MALRCYDVFAKPLEGTRQRSISGGLITILASSAAAVLFLSQLFLYLKIQPRHSMHLADSVPSMLFDPHHQHENPKFSLASNLIKLRMHVTFPHLPCGSLDYAQDGISESQGLFQHYHSKPYTFTLRIPTVEEYRLSVAGGYSEQNINTLRNNGCTMVGTIITPRVGSILSVTISSDAWTRATSRMVFDNMGNAIFDGSLPNITHYIHDITFGDPFPLGTNPLRNVHHVIDNESGVALAKVAVKLVHTTYQRTFSAPKESYQASVVKYIIQPEVLAEQQSTLLPGLMMMYDFTPLAVRHLETRENWLVFLSSLVSIIGGVFVTVGLVTGCLIDSAKAVAKKID